MPTERLVVAGEASGDRAAAAVLAALGGEHHAFGLGGPACAAAGLTRISEPAFGAVGFFDVLRRGTAVVRSFCAALAAARTRRPAAALLVDYTEFNFHLAPRLRDIGTRVLWYVAPQVWAWRPSRLRTLPPRIDAMAVLLPFEEALWREAGVDADYVGHPSIHAASSTTRDAVRRELSLDGTTVALLPGSRPSEVRRLLPPMLDAVMRLRLDSASFRARLILAASLDGEIATWARRLAAHAYVPVVDAPIDGAARILGGFDGSLCASGTASLEAALAGAAPVVSYLTDALTARVVSSMLRTPFVALPNVLLGRPIWPELLQDDATGPKMARAMRNVLERRASFDDAARELRVCLGEERKPASLVASRLRRWLRESQSPRSPCPAPCARG
ncbi:lipid-A-disaccharide synthase [soil metagenome]